MLEVQQRTLLHHHIQDRNLRDAREMLLSVEPPVVADFLKEASLEDAVVLFRILPRRFATDIFESIGHEHQQELLQALGDGRGRILLNEMAADDRTSLLEEVPAPAVKKLLNLLSPDKRLEALSLLGYPEYSVGRLMTPEYIAVQMAWPVERVLAHIREYGEKSESLDVLYVTDGDGVLKGQVRTREILLASPYTRIEELATEAVISLIAYADQEEAVRLFMKYNMSVLPVLDSQDQLLGIVTIDDVLSIAEEEATEDIQKFGGSEALSEPYLSAQFSTLLRSRAGWLVLLFLGEMLTASAMAAYETQLEKVVVLALFIPLIISSGGNSGSQAATLIIRALSLGEIQLKDWTRVFRRELGSGLVLGSVLGFLGFLRVVIWAQFLGFYGDQWFPLSITVACALLLVVLWGTLSGALFPFLLKRLGADPATSSAPFVATVVDVVGLVFYFTVASIMFAGIG